MPYISAKDDRRERLRNGEPAQSAGELNYQIFYWIKHNISQGFPVPEQNIIRFFIVKFLGNYPNYQRYNDMVGCLTLCAKEIKRRLEIDVKKPFEEIIGFYDKEIGIYEDLKITQNGDVE